MAREAYDSQAQLQLMADQDMGRAMSKSDMERGITHSFVDSNGAVMSNGHGSGPPRPPPGYHASVQGNAPAPSTPQAHHMMVGATPHSGADPNADYGAQDESSRRKRSKVSRACDECRRKKVDFRDLSSSLILFSDLA